MDSPEAHDAPPPEEDEIADVQDVLRRQDGEETPVECGYCNRSFPFRTTRLLLAEDFGEAPATDERYIFLCEDCWWEVIGNPRQEELRSVMTAEELAQADATSGAGVDAVSLVAELKQHEDGETAA